MPDRDVFRNRVAVAGVGLTELSKDSGVSTLALALQSVHAALDDAGLTVADLDGVACHRVVDSPDPAQVAQCLGLQDIGFVLDVFGGGSSSIGMLLNAANAIAVGAAETVVCWRALNARSEVRMGGTGALAAMGDAQYWLPYAHISPPQLFALFTRPYLEHWGYGSEDLGNVAIAQRDYAVLNPRAMLRAPLTMDDYLASRWIAEPLRLFDCCLESDGAIAIVLTTADRVKDLRQPEVLIRGGAIGPGYQLMSNGWTDWSTCPAAALTERLYRNADVSAGDIDVAELYDAFTPLVLMQLEGFGLCAPGEAGEFVRNGNTGIDGKVPVNTHGGHLSCGYVHGLNHVAEAVQQLRGQSGDRQVDGARTALASSQPGIASGLSAAIVLGGER